MRHRMHIIAFFLFVVIPAHAQMPTNMNYQGRLVDGTNLLSGSHTIEFRIYDTNVDGTIFYAESDTVMVDDGFYATELGDNAVVEGSLGGGEPYFDGLAELFAYAEKYGQYWLELEVDGTTLTPREKILSTAYAMVAQEAMGVAHGSITSADIEDGAITSADIANRTIQPYDLSLSARSTLASADGSPDDALVVDGDGNVGIGTEQPGAGLQVDAGVELLAPELRSVMRDSDGTFTNLNGTACTVVSGNYAYISAAYDDAITVVDVSNPDAPSLVTVLKHNEGGFNYLDYVIALVVDGSYLYAASIGGGSDGDSAISIISIADPAHPSLEAVLVDNVAGYNKLWSVSSLCVHDNHLFIPSFREDAVTIVDVSNPAAPSLAAVLEDGSGSFTLLNGAHSVACEGDYAYISSYYDDSLTIIDISSPSSPQFIADISGVDFDGARGVAVSGGYVYVAARLANQLTVVDCRTPAAPVVVAAVRHGTGGFNYLDEVIKVCVAGNRLYAAAYLSDAVTVIDVSNPLSPRPLAELVDGQGEFDALDGVLHVHAVGDRIYITSEFDDAVTIADVDGADGKAGLYVADRVGIGTPLPREALDVRGNIIASGDLYLEKYAGNDYEAYVRMDSSGRLYADSIQSSYVAVPPCAFRPGNDGTGITAYHATGARMGSGTEPMYAPVQLPHGAENMYVVFYYYDYDASSSLYMSLRKNDFDSQEWEYNKLLASATSSDTPHLEFGFKYEIVNPYLYVSNTSASYYLYIYPDSGSWSSDLYFKGAKIYYEIGD